MKDHLEKRIKEINAGLEYEVSLLSSLEKQVADTTKKIAGLSCDLTVYNNALATEVVNQKVGWHHHPLSHRTMADEASNQADHVIIDPLQAEFSKMLCQDPKAHIKVEDLDKRLKPNMTFLVQEVNPESSVSDQSLDGGVSAEKDNKKMSVKTKAAKPVKAPQKPVTKSKQVSKKKK